ncbi:MAG: hypothetical protein ACOVN8_05525, partial [Burkholderiaceae bacterium]
GNRAITFFDGIGRCPKPSVPAKAKTAPNHLVLAIYQVTLFVCARSESGGSQSEQTDGNYSAEYMFHVRS